MATTLLDIRTEVRNRADLNNTQFITDTEMNSYINYSLLELHGLLVNAYGGDYFVTHYTGSVNPNEINLQPSLPDDCYKVMGVDLEVGYNKYITLSPFNFNERNRASSQNVKGYATQNYTTYRYRVLFDSVTITPAATGIVNMRVWYVPTPPKLVLDTDEVVNNDALCGWIEYVITDVCIKCKEKEETDASVFMRQKAMLTERIRNEAQNRDLTPAQVTDVYANGVFTDVNGTYASRWWDWYSS